MSFCGSLKYMWLIHSNCTVHDAPRPYSKQVKEEQAAQANHDRQVQLQDMKNKELDSLIILQDMKNKELEYQLKIKSLDIEAKEKKHKHELELEKAQVERVSKEIELRRMKIAISQEDATAATT